MEEGTDLPKPRVSYQQYYAYTRVLLRSESRVIMVVTEMYVTSGWVWKTRLSGKLKPYLRFMAMGLRTRK